jgi:ABC-type glycerol-3-phosphate transport system substrate-binding protein
MRRRTLLVSLLALAGCGSQDSPLEVICDPELGEAARAALRAYQSAHPDVRATVTVGAAPDLLVSAEAAGARVLITREIRLADRMQRTRRAPLENRWKLGSVEDPIAVVVTAGAGQHAAKAFAEWLSGPEGQAAFKPIEAVVAPSGP